MDKVIIIDSNGTLKVMNYTIFNYYFGGVSNSRLKYLCADTENSILYYLLTDTDGTNILIDE
jgi:hypothetical protein